MWWTHICPQIQMSGLCRVSLDGSHVHGWIAHLPQLLHGENNKNSYSIMLLEEHGMLSCSSASILFRFYIIIYSAGKDIQLQWISLYISFHLLNTGNKMEVHFTCLLNSKGIRTLLTYLQTAVHQSSLPPLFQHASIIANSYRMQSTLSTVLAGTFAQ